IASGMILSGCGATSPRFRSGEKQKPAPVTEKKPTVAPVQGEDKETKSEDAENVLSGKRSFKTEKNTALSNLDQSKVMRQISKLMGTPYKLGGETEEGIDCSAYTMTVYKNSIKKELPRTSAEQFKIGKEVAFEDLKFGDLVFFNTTGESASHVGIYLGDDLFAHASVSLGVTISSLESFYYKKRYEGARRIVY
ncbi:MAG: C40 family peptidase, partial [Ignavibacteriales bacterium]|nr:C40 family peptidase [Ignavibacteriales bacterium]